MPKATNFLIPLSLSIIICCSCSSNGDSSDDVSSKAFTNEISDNMQQNMRFALAHNGFLKDSTRLTYATAVNDFYTENGFLPVWSKAGSPTIHADSMFHFIQNAMYYGLFPDDYHAAQLKQMQEAIAADSLVAGARRDAVLWMQYELVLTDAFIGILHDVDVGRLKVDSTFLRPDSIFQPKPYLAQLALFIKGTPLSSIVQTHEPKHADYHALKLGLRRFLDTAKISTNETYIDYPIRDQKIFLKQVTQRLKEVGALPWNTEKVDSVVLRNAILAVQDQRGLTKDGKYGPQLINSLNLSSREKLIRIALNLDRYKKLPRQMPERYIWVNLPGYYLQVREQDNIVLRSDIIVGKPRTRTPLLHSTLGNIVTYPQWTIPNSIIVKEILPALKRNSGYLAKKGYRLYNFQGEKVDAGGIDWSKYNRGIPYKIIQGSGDNNALGVLKFNFANPFDVYMHDTNQRYYFSRSERALSHGCVRVQAWDSLSRYVTALDSSREVQKQPPAILDSLHKWLENKQKRTISLRYKLPLYFRYVTVEMKNGELVFYDDIYGEDGVARRQLMKVP